MLFLQVKLSIDFLKFFFIFNQFLFALMFFFYFLFSLCLENIENNFFNFSFYLKIIFHSICLQKVVMQQKNRTIYFILNPRNIKNSLPHTRTQFKYICIVLLYKFYSFCICVLTAVAVIVTDLKLYPFFGLHWKTYIEKQHFFYFFQFPFVFLVFLFYNKVLHIKM